MFDVLARANRNTLESRKEIRIKGLTLPYASGNLPAYAEVKMLKSVEAADITPKLKTDPFKYSTKQNGVNMGSMPKAIP